MLVLRDGRTGDDSLDGIGEFAADVTRLVCSFFAGGIEDVDDSRRGLGAFVAVCSPLAAGAAAASNGSAVSCVAALEMGVEGLSSMVVAVLFGSNRRVSTSGVGTLIAQPPRANGNNSRVPWVEVSSPWVKVISVDAGET